MRRTLAALLLLLAPALAAAVEFPDRPLRVLVGYAAGGTADLTGRAIAEALGPQRQTVVVENRPGANGMIAAEAVARGAPDGSTIMVCPMGTMAISPNLPGQRLPVDVVQEIVPVANVVLSTYGLVVAKDSAIHSTAELLAAARAQPGKLTYASAGIGSAQHLAGEMLSRMAQVEMVHVPYRGAAPAIIDMIGGRVDFFITNLGDVAGQVRDGSLRLLAVADAQGHPSFPAPRIAEAVPGFEIAGWFAACGPRGMPREAIAAWSEAIRTGLQRPELRQRLLENGLTPLHEDAATLAARLERNRAQFRAVIQAANIRAE